MACRQFLTLVEVEALVNDEEFMESIENDTNIDIIQLPPDKVDQLSDSEEIDENELAFNSVKRDVTGKVEVHIVEKDKEPTTPPPKQRKIIKKDKEPTTPPLKRRKIIVSSDFQDPCSSKSIQVEQTITKPIQKKDIKKNLSIAKWRKAEPNFVLNLPSENFIAEHKKGIHEELKNKTPVDVFETLFDEELMKHIVDQSILYAAQNNDHDFLFTTDCLRKFLGVLLFSGYHHIPQEHLYWCEDEDMATDCVRKCFARHRWIQIKRNLHFNNNNEIPPDGSAKKCFKILPLYDMLNKNFFKFGVFSQKLSIDEQMVRYYGHHFLKQFIRGKPIRFGFKQWALCCGETGYLFHTELYEGKQGENEVREMQTLGASVVMRKVSLVDSPQHHSFYFDNYFTTYALMKKLTEINVCATGTAQLKMMNKCPIKEDTIMKKEKRGTYDYAFDTESNVFAVSWRDNNNVKVMSNIDGLHPIQKVNRWSKSEKKQVKVDQPYCIAAYNKSMGGVDKMDWLVNKYRTKIKGKKWYFPIFTYLVDTAMVNAHILFCMTNTQMPLLDFRRSVARTYLAKSSISDPRNAGRPSFPKESKKRVEEAVRLDPVGHALERTNEGKQRKCGVCKKNARKQCSKCNVGLHVSCFTHWHMKK